MQKKWLLLSFIEGATVMAAELCGARLLAPVFGGSLYVWASVMGITLLALALGYFFGGYLSVKPKEQQRLFIILNGAVFFVLLMPVSSCYLIPFLSYLPFFVAVVLSTLLLLFLPVFFLGASSPLFIFIQTDKLEESGRISGTVYAVSTAGGILATFLCGFYLIPEIGLKACLTVFGLLLFIVNYLVFKVIKTSHLVFLVGILFLNYFTMMHKSPNIYESEGIMGRMELRDIITEEGDSIRLLKLNTIIQTEMNKKTHKSVSEYLKVLDCVVPASKEPAKALILGLGGGVTANLFSKKNYASDCVEFDERILNAAKDYFYLPSDINLIHADARFFINSNSKKYDLVLVDLFKAEEQPAHVITKESLEKLKTCLSDSALLLINWHGYISSKIGSGTSIMYQTLLESGFDIKLFATGKNENYRNVIFAASLSGLNNLNSLYAINENPSPTTIINTDDKPVLENHNAVANMIWRKNYLAYYPSK